MFKKTSGTLPNNLLESYLKKRVSATSLKILGEKSNAYIKSLKSRVALFESVLAFNEEKPAFTPDQKHLLKKQFPFIFVSESDKIEDYDQNEFRSRVPLKLGDDCLFQRIWITDSE